MCAAAPPLIEASTMKYARHPFALLAIMCLTSAALAADKPEWTLLFNGKDLSNWVNVNGAPETWTVHDGMIACTGKPTGALRTPRMYENFEIELEWRHLKP